MGDRVTKFSLFRIFCIISYDSPTMIYRYMKSSQTYHAANNPHSIVYKLGEHRSSLE